MQLQELKLIQFRNYAEQTIPLSPVTVFWGENGTGKTNALEAVRILSVGRSWRTLQDRDLIMWEKEYCRVEGKAVGKDANTYSVVIEQRGTGVRKSLQTNGTTLPLNKQYGTVATVLFTPETLQEIDGSPADRRRFIDAVLSQTDRNYLSSLMEYRKVLRERRFVLIRLAQGLGEANELDYWDSVLVTTGSYIIGERAKFIASINQLLPELYAEFGKKQNQIALQYRPAVENELTLEILAKQRASDIRANTTLLGPHRDELIFLLNNRDIRLGGSRGEKRSCIVATKLSEAAYMTAARERPIVLLDDVFSELDNQTQKRLAKVFRDYQTIMTTTEKSFIDDKKLKDVELVEMPLK